MIEFRVKNTGAILDISPDATFQIEIENPMFSDDKCSLAYSTEISFLPTQHNKEQLGYLAAMLLLPSILTVDVEVYASGIKILDGMLEFSSIKDDVLNYTFAGRSLEDDWGGKIYDKQIHRIPGDPDEQLSDMQDIMIGNVDGVYLPLLVNASETDKVTIYGELPGSRYSDCSFEVKYHNYPILSQMSAAGRVITPAISVLKILENELQNVSIGSLSVEDMLARTVILGQYKTDYTGSPSGIPASGLDVARTLPDISAMELFRTILKMFCCALYRDGDAFIVQNIGSVINREMEILDWDDKISRGAEISQRPAGGYKFSFGNDADEDFNPNETITSTDSFKNTLRSISAEEFYQAFRHSSAGHVISARKSFINYGSGPNSWAYICDLLTANNREFDFEPKDRDGDIVDNSVSAKLARAIPDSILPGGEIQLRNEWRMATIINPENIGDKRGSDVIIGKIDNINDAQQLSDGALYYDDDEEIVALFSSRLTAESLFYNYHQSFANWCRSTHQVVSSDLELTAADISSFRMWYKVSFSGRTWLVRKLTVTFSAASNRCDASAEFVSVN